MMKNILHVTHGWGGGIQCYVDDISNSLSNVANNYILNSDGSRLDVSLNGIHLKAYYLKIREDNKAINFYNDEYRIIYEEIIDNYNIDILHLHSLLFHTFDLFNICSNNSIKFIVTIHDFYFICPTFHLVDHCGNFCGVCNLNEENAECIENHPYVFGQKYNGDTLNKFRKTFVSHIECIDCIVFPSKSTYKIFRKFYKIDILKCKIFYHPSLLRNLSYRRSNVSRNGGALKVALLGSALMHKGSEILKALVANLENDKNIIFYHYGKGSLSDPNGYRKNLIERGSYNRSEIQQMLQDDAIDLVAIISTWPETFCYTLSEAVLSGIPVIVSNQGALSERVKKFNVGIVLDNLTYLDIALKLAYIAKNKEVLDPYVNYCHKYKPIASHGFYRQFKKIYLI